MKEHDYLYAFICPEKGEGIIAIGPNNESQLPLVFMSMETVNYFLKNHRALLKASGKKVELRKYKFMEVIQL